MAKTKFKSRATGSDCISSQLSADSIDRQRIYYVVFRRRTVVCRLYDRFRRVVADKFRIRGTSVFYSSWSFRLVSFTDKPYLRLFICAFLLLLFNNLTVWCFSLLINICFDEGLAFFHQGLYIFSVMATFVSYIYTDAQYMESSILAERQKKELEITLLKEKEHAAQMQLEVLKSQIDPHFMFNNFSILSELIVEDTALAEKFLDNLSKVYRYVIQNLKRDTVSIEEEIAFLHSYIYLIKMCYEDAVCINIDETLKQIDGQIPPVCLQLLVENAIKHNRASARHPLSIRVFREENDIVVENDLRPIASDFESTGIGNKNIVGRYLLLCKKKLFIEQRENTYIVKLPIIIILNMNVLILEDEQRNFNRLRRQLEEIDTTFHVEGPLANIQESVEWLRTHPTPDLILADIRLSDGLSFDILRQTAIPSPIIFTTAYDEYAIQAFKYNSFDYLLKPINSEELAEAINKVRRRTLSDTHGEDMRRLVEYMYRNNYRYRERFLLPYRDGYISVQVKNISHIALKERTTLIFLNDGASMNISYSLDELESQLNPDIFFRANRQYLLHIDSIRNVSNYFNSRLKIHMKKYPDTEIIVSRERASALKEWLDK